MSILKYSIFNRIRDYKSNWFNTSININEGIQFSYDELDPAQSSISLDYSNDLDSDIVKLENPRDVRPTRFSRIATFAGYAMENIKDIKRAFADYIKEWGSISLEDLKSLIDHTYPLELEQSNVKVIFVMGSNAPLSANIATSLKEMYYPNAKIVDIMKAYYGIDIKDTVDWEKYELADDRTKKMIDSYISTGGKNFSGYIKKSGILKSVDSSKKEGGVQSGARTLLKPGHSIDDYIISVIKEEQDKWWKLAKSGAINQGEAIKQVPKFLIVDDLAIEGSTLRGAIGNILKAIDSKEANITQLDIAKRNLIGYVLFAYGTRFN